MSACQKFLVGLGVAALCVGGYFFYISQAFPEVRCEGAKHLERPEEFADCVTCHAKVTPKVSQDWLESKHGVMMVKCVVCHGEPDGKGSVPFAKVPDPNRICAQCHGPAMVKMTEKFGVRNDCETCHPNHQNPMHGKAYENKIPTDKVTF